MTSNGLNGYEIIALVINGALALFTATMAGFTAWMAHGTHELAQQTKNSIDVERAAIEQSKDSLMPVLVIRMNVRDQDDNSGERFELRVRNIGTGPAFAHEITVRNEISLGGVYQSGLRSAIIPPLDEVGGLFGETSHNPVQIGRISSLSIWYTDVYGRWYRTRVIVQYPERGILAARILTSEFVPHIDVPSFSYGDANNMFPDNYVGRYELGRLVHPGGLLSPQWHTLQAIQRSRETTIPAADISHGAPIQVLDMSWWFGQPLPEFTLQIRGYGPFVLGIRRNHDDGSQQPIIMDVETLHGFYASMPPPLIPNAHRTPLEQWGLNNTNRAETDLLALHRTIIDTIKALINPVKAPNES